MGVSDEESSECNELWTRVEEGSMANISLRER